jgi:sugar phosphate isomerase/epimerase
MPTDPPILPRSWKKRYPFRTGTTSFIYPAGYAENVARLGPHLDEIELLMFESQSRSRPSDRLVQDLLVLGHTHAIRYNVHLPTDLPLTHPDRSVRDMACRILQEFVITLMPLNPTVYVLHLPPPDLPNTGEDLHVWQRIAEKTLGDILETGLSGRRLALENLFFPFKWLTPLLEAFDLGVCLDTGHLALQNGDLEGFLTDHDHRIVIAHLHGLHEGRDHGPLSGLPVDYQTLLTAWLGRFEGSASLEVFGYEPLLASLHELDRMMSPGD